MIITNRITINSPLNHQSVQTGRVQVRIRRAFSKKTARHRRMMLRENVDRLIGTGSSEDVHEMVNAA